jgi:hypothetical protein
MFTRELADLQKLERGDLVLDSGSTYDGIAPVLTRVRKREGQFEFSDGGGAVAAAGVDGKQHVFCDSIRVGEYSANVTRQGVVWLPGFSHSSEEWLTTLPELVAEASLALYQALLELDERPTVRGSRRRSRQQPRSGHAALQAR